MQDTTLGPCSDTSVEALLISFQSLMAGCEGTFSEREVAALTLANELVRQWAQSALNQLAEQHPNEILVDGQLHRRHTTGTRRYHTLCGPVLVRRDCYRLVGVHNGPTVVPLELEAGLVENATPALALSVVQAFATMPLRQYEQEMKAAHRAVPSRSTLERIAKRTADHLHDQLPLIEPVVRADEPIPQAAASISVGVDRTTIPMAEPLPRLPARWHRKLKRRPPPPVVVAYRMAYVATVAINDRLGTTISSKRIAATAEEGPIELMERLGAEVQHLLARRPRLPVIVVQDGAPELWNLVEEWFANFGIEIEQRLIDRYHVEERLSQVADVLERDQHARWRLLAQWRAALERSDTAIVRICREIEHRLYLPPLPRQSKVDVEGSPFGFDPQWKPAPVSRFAKDATTLVESNVSYCRNYREKLHYASARKRGFPIGSGVTEGACKSVIASRLKRSGQRWFERGASACLQLRTLHLNERLPPSFALFIEHRRDLLIIN